MFFRLKILYNVPANIVNLLPTKYLDLVKCSTVGSSKIRKIINFPERPIIMLKIYLESEIRKLATMLMNIHQTIHYVYYNVCCVDVKGKIKLAIQIFFPSIESGRSAWSPYSEVDNFRQSQH